MGAIEVPSQAITIVTANGSQHQMTPASSVSSVQDELSALQRAQIHLYKRLQQVKTQTYAALVVVVLLAGVILMFIANYHTDSHRNILKLQAAEAILSQQQQASISSLASQRIGKALSYPLKDSSQRSNPMNEENPSMNHLDWNEPDKISNAAKQTGGQELIASASEVNESETDSRLLATTVLPVSSTQPPTTVLMATSTSGVPGESAQKVLPVQLQPIAPVIANVDNRTYTIRLTVHNAAVPNMDYSLLGRASDTFCEVLIDGRQAGSTHIIDNDNSPKWEHQFAKLFKVSQASSIRFDLYDMDHLKKDHIGGALVNFGDLVQTGRVNKPISLFHGRGDVWVSIQVVA